ncbi:hypothetical protein EV122DRAFT_283399 [Schizophyllum commune]
MLRGVKRGMPLFEEQEMAEEMYHRLSKLSSDCHWVVRYLAGAYPENRLCSRGREEMLRVHAYSDLVVDALAAYYEILCTVVKAIRCDSSAFDSFCAELITRYDALQRSLDHTITSGAQLLDTLADFKQYVVGKFAYPPFTHFLVMNILGPSWTPREKAFSIVPPRIQEMSEEVEAGVALAARLKLSVSSMPLYPEQEMAGEMCGNINRIDFACHWVDQFLAGAYPDNKLCAMEHHPYKYGAPSVQKIAAVAQPRFK